MVSLVALSSGVVPRCAAVSSIFGAPTESLRRLIVAASAYNVHIIDVFHQSTVVSLRRGRETPSSPSSSSSSSSSSSAAAAAAKPSSGAHSSGTDTTATSSLGPAITCAAIGAIRNPDSCDFAVCVAAGDAAGAIHFWSVAESAIAGRRGAVLSFESVASVSAHSRSVESLSWDGGRFASVSGDGTVCLWGTDISCGGSLALLHRLSLPRSRGIVSCCMRSMPGGATMLALGGVDCRLHLICIDGASADTRGALTLSGFKDWVRSVDMCILPATDAATYAPPPPRSLL
jgi:WD40 repeat protein